MSTKAYEIKKIADTVAEAYEEEQWVHAARHHLGGGLERGTPSLEVARKMRKHLAKNEMWERITALDAVVCCGSVHHHRFKLPGTCFRCEAEDSAWHRYWACEKLQHHTDDAVTKSSWLKDVLAGGLEWAECLWARAILPASMRGTDLKNRKGDSSHVKTSPGFWRAARTAKTFATDGSGGPSGIPKDMRKCASGVALVGMISVTSAEVLAASVVCTNRATRRGLGRNTGC